MDTSKIEAFYERLDAFLERLSEHKKTVILVGILGLIGVTEGLHLATQLRYVKGHIYYDPTGSSREEVTKVMLREAIANRDPDTKKSREEIRKQERLYRIWDGATIVEDGKKYALLSIFGGNIGKKGALPKPAVYLNRKDVEEEARKQKVSLKTIPSYEEWKKGYQIIPRSFRDRLNSREHRSQSTL